MFDIHVKTNNPADLDRIVQTMGAVVEQYPSGDYVVKNGVVNVRCFGDADYVIYAIESQGYGTVIPKPDPKDKIDE